ncbi:hypothetical protein [Streptomyces sp. NPDC056169]
MREVDLDVFATDLAEGAFAVDVREPDDSGRARTGRPIVCGTDARAA